MWRKNDFFNNSKLLECLSTFIQNIKHIQDFKKGVYFQSGITILKEKYSTQYVKCQKALVVKNLTKIKK